MTHQSKHDINKCASNTCFVEDLTHTPLEDTPDPSPTVCEGCFFLCVGVLGKSGVSSQGMWAKSLILVTSTTMIIVFW